MTKELDLEPDRISKREFISRVAVRSGQSVKTVSVLYEAIFDELTASVMDGEIIVLTGFGRFSKQLHKGHKVRFGPAEVKEYSVVKFSSSRTLNQQIDPGRRAQNQVVPA